MSEDKSIDRPSTFMSTFSRVLDPRILKALSDIGFARPTLVQNEVIPLALEGHDILARARTGSGKTAAYCIPLVQKIIQAKSSQSGNLPVTRAVILVPTKELSEQVFKYLRRLVAYCEDAVTICNIASGDSNQLRKMVLADIPDFVVGTPTRILSLLKSKALDLSSLESLVIDEADLILSYGHDADVRSILSGDFLPKVYQSFLMSATMTSEVETLKGLVLRNPAILCLDEKEDEAASLSQYFVRCTEVDKFLLVYVILMLKLVKGKCILFVNDVDRAYRLKLFLEQFSIKSCVLNPELPINSRFHIVQEFNRGVYEYVIASDESGSRVDVDEGEAQLDDEVGPSVDGANKKSKDSKDSDGDPDADSEVPSGIHGAGSGDPSTSRPKRKLFSPPPDDLRQSKRPKKNSKKRRNGKADTEYGVSRGVDFVNVACVINFDLPTTSRGYTHRVGRTARAGRSGLAISFIVPKAEYGKGKKEGVTVPSAYFDDEVFRRIEEEQVGKGTKINEYQFDMKLVEGFRYRMEDALRSVTKVALKEARMKELKNELLNSAKLKAHFEDNPHDLELLRHNKLLYPARIQSHMKHVPKYLVPRMAPLPGTDTSNDTGHDSRKQGERHENGRRGHTRGRGRGRGRGARRRDPLKSFGK